MSEHDFEPVRGLPADLPAGETLLWQGAPDWWQMARRVFHVPLVGAYFLGLALWRGGSALAAGEGWAAALSTTMWTVPLAVVALGLLMGLAWINARTTVYTITSARVVMRFGAALTKAINIPFKIIESASFKQTAGTAGDVAIKLCAPNKIAFLLLWPHARPDRVVAPEPTLRCLPDGSRAADVLAAALCQAHNLPAPVGSFADERAAGEAGARDVGDSGNDLGLAIPA